MVQAARSGRLMQVGQVAGIPVQREEVVDIVESVAQHIEVVDTLPVVVEAQA